MAQQGQGQQQGQQPGQQPIQGPQAPIQGAAANPAVAAANQAAGAAVGQIQGQAAQQPAAPVPQLLQAQQFADFMAADRRARAENFQATTDRQMADTQARRIPVCDGSSAVLVREWINDVDLSTNYSNRPVYVAAHSSTGPLRRELERFLDTQPNRHHVPWDLVRAHISEAFLTPLENDRLRDEITRIAQQPEETIASYNRRFIELADRAYPRPGVNQPRNEDQNRTLLEQYVRGLRDDHVADRLVTHGHPANHEEAITMAQDYARDVFRLRLARRPRQTRVEEPMEINAVAAGAQASDTTQEPWRTAHLEMTRRVDGLSRQVTRMMSILETPGATAAAPAARSRRTQLAAVASDADAQRQLFTEDGSPVCNYCGRKGHVTKQCRKKQRDLDRSSGPGNKNQGGH